MPSLLHDKKIFCSAWKEVFIKCTLHNKHTCFLGKKKCVHYASKYGTYFLTFVQVKFQSFMCKEGFYSGKIMCQYCFLNRPIPITSMERAQECLGAEAFQKLSVSMQRNSRHNFLLPAFQSFVAVVCSLGIYVWQHFLFLAHQWSKPGVYSRFLIVFLYVGCCILACWFVSHFIFLGILAHRHTM